MANESPARDSRSKPAPRKKSVPKAKAETPKPKSSQQAAAANGKANGQPKRRSAAVQDAAEGRGAGASLREFFKQTPSWLTSMVVHVVVLLVLGLLMLPEVRDLQRDLVSSLSDKEEKFEELEDDPLEKIDELDVNPEELTTAVETPIEKFETPTTSIIPEPEGAPPEIELGGLKPQFFKKAQGRGITGEGSGGRTGAGKQALLAAGGGNKHSEEAVARALKWLAAHQMPDGGWSFDHRPGKCGGRCKDPGRLNEARFGATGLALMCFLGAGQTHKEGDYKRTVGYGLEFLKRNMNRQTGQMYRAGGNMYSHGIATIAICEAAGMTDDRKLLPFCKMGILFILNAQDPNGGGWRYSPKTPGDTSVVGWQLMALKSAKWAYIKVPPNTIKGVEHFLNSVQTDSGAKYGYTTPGAGRATTAVGLLCRMYMGWKKDNPAIERGVQFLANLGPSKNNVYYNYYAAQVLRQYEGPLWEKFNVELRDYLIETQKKDKGSHEYGSWYFNGGHGATQGGRHYTTCMNCMTLEVYYRHLPLYRTKASEDEFDD